MTDEEALAGMREIASTEGVFAAPEGGAVWAGIKKLVQDGAIDRDERVVLMNTGTGASGGRSVPGSTLWPTAGPVDARAGGPSTARRARAPPRRSGR